MLVSKICPKGMSHICGYTSVYCTEIDVLKGIVKDIEILFVLDVLYFINFYNCISRLAIFHEASFRITHNCSTLK